MQVGTAWEDITPDRPLHLLGQMRERLGEYTRDPLTTNAIVLDDGVQRIALVSIDVCMIPEALMHGLKQRCAEAAGLEPGNIIIAATHTHVAPCTTDRLFGSLDADWIEQLHRATAGAVRGAVADLAEAQLYAGRGYLTHMGWNRRGLKRDGRANMYHGSWLDDFVGIEGPRDGEVGVVFAGDEEGNVKAVLSSFSTHPNCLEQGEFYSADIPGEVRRVLRAALGEHVGVVHMTGAAGDTAPKIMDEGRERTRTWSGELGLKRSGLYLGGEILKVIGEQVDQPMPQPTLALERADLSIPMRPWDPWFDVTVEYPNPETSGMHRYFHDSYANWQEQVRTQSPVTVPVRVVRIGDAAVCTNPAELYCRFGLAIKERSPARVTLVSELTDGYVGYVPTSQAIRHMGYSAAWANHTNLQADAGWQIADATVKLLDQVFEPVAQATVP